MIRRLVLSSIFLTAAVLFNCSKDLSVDSGSEPILAANEISISYYNYSLPSMPAPLLDNKNYVQGDLSWYNPYERYLKSKIRPDIKIPPQYAQTQDILRLKFAPDTTNPSLENSWAGVMQFLDKEDTVFAAQKQLDIMLQYDQHSDKTIRLHIEFGAFSEDVFPNGTLDTEDRNGNHRLDSGENMGLDGMANDDSRAISAGGDFWDINGNGVKDEGEKYSNDDWLFDPYKTSPDGGIDYSSVNGTEGNQRSNAAGIIPDTEDLNQNGVLDLDNNYFTFELHLSPEHEHYAKYVTYEGIEEETGMDYGWRLYSIPLDACKEIGSPSWEHIESMRLWIDGYDGETVLALASIEINEKLAEN